MPASVLARLAGAVAHCSPVTPGCAAPFGGFATGAPERRAGTALPKYRLAKTIGVAPTRVGEIIHGARAISPDTALRLSRALGTSARFWSNLQIRYDLERAREAHTIELDQIQSLVAT